MSERTDETIDEIIREEESMTDTPRHTPAHQIVTLAAHGDKVPLELAQQARDIEEAMREALQAEIDDWHSNTRNIERSEPKRITLARAALALADGKGEV